MYTLTPTCHLIKDSLSSKARRTTISLKTRARVLASLSRLKPCSHPMYSVRLMLPLVLGMPLSASLPSRHSCNVRQSEIIECHILPHYRSTNISIVITVSINIIPSLPPLCTTADGFYSSVLNVRIVKRTINRD